MRRHLKLLRRDISVNQMIWSDAFFEMDGHLAELIDSSWRTDQLPLDEIEVPAIELPDPEADFGRPGSEETMREIESKWRDLNLQSLSPNFSD
ncbi:unnamed protein product [Nezara viridula]|uniref:Anaphase-promoting complex subunit 13 n=1 Tax=Nezara viridula TaxID=85310 RepID=A0A9P0MRR9_NEZVI|nr:unnamed protein product [Nezara viridula]